jgi:N-acetylmuramoyl-L-alanine amidase
VLLCLAAGPAGAQPLVEPGPARLQAATLAALSPVIAASPARQSGRTDPNSATPIVLGARLGEQPDRTRFVVEVSDPVDVKVFALANPDRIVIDMPEMLWRLPVPERPSGRGAVSSFRYGLYRPGVSRFVIDLNRPLQVAEPKVLVPGNGYGFRIVFDFFPTTQAKFASGAGWPAELAARETAREQPTAGGADIAAAIDPAALGQPGKPHIIVIDPGHGGVDSGTTGVGGLQEKNLVLDEAGRLKKVLEKRGYIVYLTRKTDVYIPLHERVQIARGFQADLLISLHADSNPDTQVEGASVYTLSESGSDREAAELARKENQSDAIAGVNLAAQNGPVASILIDLAQRDTINRSSRFAETAVAQMSRVTDVLARDPHRSAAFAVLKAPDVPAVLIELGYLSNNHDSSRMGTEEWREETAGAIADAVDRQFGRTPGISSISVPGQ